MFRYDTIPLEFAGYCPIALLSGTGLLLPGNAGLGTLKWRGRYYVCSTVDRAEQFGVEPDLYISAVAGLVARHTVLEQILMTSSGLSGQAHDGPMDSGDVKVRVDKITVALNDYHLFPRRTPQVRQRPILCHQSSILITSGMSGI